MPASIGGPNRKAPAVPDDTPPTARPDMAAAYAAVYDWFAVNGVEEWLPETYGPVVVDTREGTLTYTAFAVEGDQPRGWDRAWIGTSTERRTVPLVTPPGDEVRSLVEQAATINAAEHVARLERKQAAAAAAVQEWQREVMEAEQEVAGAQRFAMTPTIITQ